MSQGNRPIEDVCNVFSRVFDDIGKNDDGWVRQDAFVISLKKLYPAYKSSNWWKKKLHRTVQYLRQK